MTTIDFTPSLVETAPLPVAPVTPDLAANVAAAQAFANKVYAAFERSGAAPETCADEYHTAFVMLMWSRDTPMACSCDLCACLKSEMEGGAL